MDLLGAWYYLSIGSSRHCGYIQKAVRLDTLKYLRPALTSVPMDRFSALQNPQTSTCMAAVQSLNEMTWARSQISGVILAFFPTEVRGAFYVSLEAFTHQVDSRSPEEQANSRSASSIFRHSFQQARTSTSTKNEQYRYLHTGTREVYVRSQMSMVNSASLPTIVKMTSSSDYRDRVCWQSCGSSKFVMCCSKTIYVHQGQPRT